MSKQSFNHLANEQLIDLLSVYQNNLMILEEQAARFGHLYTPLDLANEIKETLISITSIHNRITEINNQTQILNSAENSRSVIYQRLFDYVSDAYLQIRSRELHSREFGLLFTKVNSFIVKNALHIDIQDYELINQFLIITYKTSIAISHESDIQTKLYWESTLLPKMFVEVSPEYIVKMLEDVTHAHNLVIERFRGIIHEGWQAKPTNE